MPMNITIKIANGPQSIDFQCINVDPEINSVEEVNAIIEKAFQEFRDTFQGD
jgi:hypothetical protein